jgi:hypothetical protein
MRNLIDGGAADDGGGGGYTAPASITAPRLTRTG